MALIAILGEQSAASAKAPTVRLELTRAGIGVGFSRGSGSLHFRGQRYRLSIGGVSLGATVGISRVELIGNAYNLRRASDIEGTYAAAQAGLSIAGGRNAARLRNTRGVVLKLHGRTIGFMFSVDLSGMQIP